MTMHDWIDRQLHKLFDEPVNEPLPDAMKRLLDALDRDDDESDPELRH